MNPERQSRRIIWMERLPERPLCDVPWLGNSMVLSSGDINFCCFSDGVAGNVNDTPFEQIWNGQYMQRIRGELTARRLPVECQTASCPIHSGVTTDYVHKRMEGSFARMFAGTADPQEVRAHLSAVSVDARHAQTPDAMMLRVTLGMRYDGPELTADAFAGVRQADGIVRFLPNYEEFPVPFACGLPLTERERTWEFVMSDGAEVAAPTYELCIALFEKDSNPHLASNCYWSDCLTLSAVSSPQ